MAAIATVIFAHQLGKLDFELCLSAKGRFFMPIGSGGGSLGFLRAGVRIVALLMAAEAYHSLVRESVFGVLRLDLFQVSGQNLEFLAVGGLVSVLAAPIANELLFGVLPHVAVAHAAVVHAAMVPAHHLVELDVHPVLLHGEVGDGSQ